MFTFNQDMSFEIVEHTEYGARKEDGEKMLLGRTHAYSTRMIIDQFCFNAHN